MNKASLSIILLAIAAIFIISGCSNNKDVTGSAVHLSKECFDSDNGKDFYKKGSLTSEEVPDTTGLSDYARKVAESALNQGGKEDFCAKTFGIVPGAKEGDLVEYFCDDGAFSSMAYTCSRGCSNGACILPSESAPIILKGVVQVTDYTGPCTDSDGGKAFTIKGNISGTDINPDTAEDECVLANGKMMLVEKVCFTDNYGAAIFYDCSDERKVCKEGRCVAAEPAAESTNLTRVYTVISDEVITTEPGCSFGGSGNYKPTAKGYINIKSGLMPAKPEFKGLIGSTIYDGCDLDNRNQRIEHYCDSNGYAHRAIVECLHGCQKEVCEFD